MNTDRLKVKALTVGDNPQWVEGWYRESSGFLHTPFVETVAWVHEVNPDTLCPCTGKGDSNGKLIYDGDVLVDDWGDLWVVFWNEIAWDLRHLVTGHEDEFVGHDMTRTGNNIHDKNQ